MLAFSSKRCCASVQTHRAANEVIHIIDVKIVWTRQTDRQTDGSCTTDPGLMDSGQIKPHRSAWITTSEANVCFIVMWVNWPFKAVKTCQPHFMSSNGWRSKVRVESVAGRSEQANGGFLQRKSWRRVIVLLSKLEKPPQRFGPQMSRVSQSSKTNGSSPPRENESIPSSESPPPPDRKPITGALYRGGPAVILQGLANPAEHTAAANW